MDYYVLKALWTIMFFYLSVIILAKSLINTFEDLRNLFIKLYMMSAPEPRLSWVIMGHIYHPHWKFSVNVSTNIHGIHLVDSLGSDFFFFFYYHNLKIIWLSLSASTYELMSPFALNTWRLGCFYSDTKILNSCCVCWSHGDRDI